MRIFAGVMLCFALYPAAHAQDLPLGRGGELINANCGSCHGVSRITSAAPKSRDDWQTTVDRMMSKGIDMKPDEEETVLNYLVKYFGEEVKVNTASAKDLQEQLEITAAEADAIVRARGAMPFKSFADLGKVSGLDIKKLEPLKGRLVF
jgi:mono/diheme cytochrome c family protein